MWVRIHSNVVALFHLVTNPLQARAGWLFADPLSATTRPEPTARRYASSIPWSSLEAWGCNEKINPTSGATHYDGGSLDPLEAMFIKVKAAQGGAPWVRKARAYERWRREERLGGARSVSGNDVYANADAMSQRYLHRVLGALHGQGGGAAAGQGGGQSSLLALVAAPPDNGHGLSPEMHAMYASYIGQFV
jgi:hypothetical protein